MTDSLAGQATNAASGSGAKKHVQAAFLVVEITLGVGEDKMDKWSGGATGKPFLSF